MGLLGDFIRGAKDFVGAAIGIGKKLWETVEPYVKEAIPYVTDALQSLLRDDSSSEKISRLPTYNRETATINQTKLVDQVLSQEKERNSKFTAQIQNSLSRAYSVILDSINEDVEYLRKEHGVIIDTAIVESCFQSVKDTEPMMNLVNQRFSIADKKCLEILETEDRNLKLEGFDQFRRDVFCQGVNDYFNKLSNSHSIGFKFIQDKIKDRCEQIRKENERRISLIQSFSSEKKGKEEKKKNMRIQLKKLEDLKILFSR